MNAGTPMPERGGCLTVYLLATVVFAVLGLILLITAGAIVGVANTTGAVTGVSTGVSVVPIIISVIAIIVSIVGVYGAWNWKKWGIYLIVASSVISALGTVLNGNIGSAVVSIVIELAILWYLLKDKWAAFEG